MGEIADAMIEGDLCEGCGVYLGEGPGFPQRCEGCGGNAKEFDFNDDADAGPLIEDASDDEVLSYLNDAYSEAAMVEDLKELYGIEGERADRLLAAWGSSQLPTT